MALEFELMIVQNHLSNVDSKIFAFYLGDVFEMVKTLDFTKSPEDGRVASGLKSKDGEYIPFGNDIQLVGAVET